MVCLFIRGTQNYQRDTRFLFFAGRDIHRKIRIICGTLVFSFSTPFSSCQPNYLLRLLFLCFYGRKLKDWIRRKLGGY